jgi:putative transposase
MIPGQKVKIPLLATARHTRRLGPRANGVQVNLSQAGRLTFGIVTDEGEFAAKARALYQGQGIVGLDFGFCTMFGTSQGQLLGRNWLVRLQKYDRQLIQIAARQQRRGRKPRDSARYRAFVQDVRGFIRTEVNRVINRLVKDRQPAALKLERMDFRNARLSRRMNAILRNCGRRVLKEKLADLKDRHGISSSEVPAPYTSQECSRCHYVDKKNRRTQARFECLWCGHQQHADLSGASIIGQRRAPPLGSVFPGKAKILGQLVSDFMIRHPLSERRPGLSSFCRSGNPGIPADPRSDNPYFQGAIHRARLPAANGPATKSSRPQAMVACETT